MAESISGRRIMGLIGIINLLAGPHLIIISQAGEIGQIMDQPVYRIEEIDLLPFTRNTLHLTEEQANANTIYVSMIKSVLSTPEFYFSYSLDISHTLQRLSRADPEFSKRSLFERVSFTDDHKLPLSTFSNVKMSMLERFRFTDQLFTNL